MSKNKIDKFENNTRLAELNPTNTLIRAGLKENMVLCDIGAGTGVFAFPAIDITHNTVHALEISDDMIELLEFRKKERGVDPLKITKVLSDVLPLDSALCDMILMVTVLHEIKDPASLLAEIKRVLKKTGKLVIIEFHKKATPMGPPIDHRLALEYTEEICTSFGFKTADKFLLGENFYCIVFDIL